MTDNTVKIIGAFVLADIIFNEGKLCRFAIEITAKQLPQKRLITAKRIGK